MGMFKYLRRKKVQQESNIENEQEDLPYKLIDREEVNRILEKEIKDFFPVQNNGKWYSHCFSRPSEVEYSNLPCHLRDNVWISSLLFMVLKDKGIYIPQNIIKKFIDNSQTFADLRHEHELRIVKWQINWIVNGGGNWIAPEEYGEGCEILMLYSEDVDKIIRGGVVSTLKAIGMDSEVIEEGLEKYSDIWRPRAMSLGFQHLYEPVVFMVGTPKKADEEHKKNWLANREYEYYQEHKGSVDKYGELTPSMKMTPEEHAKLITILDKQNERRTTFVEEWKRKSNGNPMHYTLSKFADDDLTK